MKKNKTILIIILVLLIGSFYMEPDDKELFMGLDLGAFVVKPNVVVMMDSSGSMNSIITYPKYGVDGIEGTPDDGYDPQYNYSGSFDEPLIAISTTYWVARWYTGTDASINSDNSDYMTGCYLRDTEAPFGYQVGGNGVNFNQDETLLLISRNNTHNGAIVTIKSIYMKDATQYFEVEVVKGGNDDGSLPTDSNYDNLRFTKPADDSNYQMRLVKLYGTQEDIPTSAPYSAPNGTTESTRYVENYLKWIFIHTTDSQREVVTHFSTHGTFDTSYTPPPEEPNLIGDSDWEAWWRSDCQNPGLDRLKYRFTRIQVAREVLCRIATMSNELVNLGLFQFEQNYDSGYLQDAPGGYKLDDVTPSNDLSSDLVAYKNILWGVRANGYTPLAETLADVWKYYKPGASGSKDYWPVNIYSSVHDIEHWCQNNYVIIMTDGESTMDQFSGDGRYDNSIFTSSSSPITRIAEYTTWAEWELSDGWGDFDVNDQSSLGRPQNYDPDTASYCPNYSCWTSNGSDYLDDVAYFLRYQDLFPDEYFGSDPVDGWPGDQNIFTYTIGFNMDNHLLRETARNGDGAYYTANNYDELIDAFEKVITGILLRNFAFSAITAPRKTATTTDNDLTVSYIGYFLPSPGSSIWEGHLLAYELEDKWGYDADGINGITEDEYIFGTKAQCVAAANGEECKRWLELASEHKWDAADKLPDPRNLYTHSGTTNIEFIDTNKATLKPLLFEDRWGYDADGMDGVTENEYLYESETECLSASDGQPCYSWLETDSCENEADQIISKMNEINFGDIFHSDVVFIGPPSAGKKYIRTIDPLDMDGEKYSDFYEYHKTRRKVLFTGTNDGVLHMLNADDNVFADEREAGVEVWGFIPDEILPSLRKIMIDHEHTYTIDGRLIYEDIYFNKGTDIHPSWATVLFFGLRRGGNAFYALDITEYFSQPSVLWKFEDPDYSGESWGKPAIGKILLEDPNDSTQFIDKWIAVLPGGFAFNQENSNDLKGKAVFVVDASNGNLIWMAGYDPDGDDDDTDNKLLTDNSLFNFPIPSSLSLIDKNNDGYVDIIYFGNLGGHFFKANISDKDVTNWEVNNLYKTNITTSADSTIQSISGDQITIQDTSEFALGGRVRGLESKAQGYITEINDAVLTVSVDAGTFIDGETIVTRTYDPIFLSPSIAYDNCFRLWAVFGTGDRDRPRTNPDKGHFIALRDNGSYENQLPNLDVLTWTDDVLTNQTLSDDKNGWYFDFPDDSEKLFDPKPIIIPDETRIPHILFDTYQPPEVIADPNQIDNPCAVPTEGIMTLYNIIFWGCTSSETMDAEQIGGSKTIGRIAGGGLYHGGKEFILYTSETGKVADAPGSDDGGGSGNGSRNKYTTTSIENPYIGGVIFWKEKKR